MCITLPLTGFQFPLKGNDNGHAYRDLEWENIILKMIVRPMK